MSRQQKHEKLQTFKADILQKLDESLQCVRNEFEDKLDSLGTSPGSAAVPSADRSPGNEGMVLAAANQPGPSVPRSGSGPSLGNCTVESLSQFCQHICLNTLPLC